MGDLDTLLAQAGAIIFDCDGTLVNTPPIYTRAWMAGFLRSGTPITADWYLARAGMSEYVLMDAFEAETGLKLNREEVVRTVRATFLEVVAELQEIAAITRIARENHGRIPMAVASGGPREIVLATLQVTGLRDLFDAVVTIEDVGRAKPAPDLFLEAARQLGVPPANVLVFEDTHEGLEAASRAGMQAVDVAKVPPQP
jgi:beta-phosphoglucomutase-like phosphatase (HAD superfamily)